MFETKVQTKLKHTVCPVQFFCKSYGFRGQQKASALLYQAYISELTIQLSSLWTLSNTLIQFKTKFRDCTLPPSQA
jgi:hypothetical protein